MREDCARTVSAQITRSKIAAVAHREFQQHGYVGADVRLIASAAGVSVGAIYGHFGSKPTLWHACMGAGYDDVLFGYLLSEADSGGRTVERRDGALAKAARVDATQGRVLK